MITSAKEFIRLRTSELKEEYDCAANDQAPLDVWWELVRNHPDMKVWVVHNKTVPLEILYALSTDQDTTVRGAVARKRKASFEILERLAHDPDASVRYAVACNKNTPPPILKMLLGDKWDVVTEKVKARLSELE